MATDSEPTDTPSDSIPTTVRLSAEEREALEYVRQLFEDKYDGAGPVLRDYSATQAVAIHRRARKLSGASV